MMVFDMGVQLVCDLICGAAFSQLPGFRLHIFDD